ncbi:hypothetical protein F0562_026838 [Nyssa sinensis]|uniref:Uncharacterized protein n=1 Tax=Nyssa sinensis TaxID=561372 RepID=A0A5J5BCD7_9ASTE|nr:hypothetical protein F0562_026838 [Nyssa sinensis]
MEFMGTMSGFVDGAMPVVAHEFSPDPDVDIMLDEIPKLPGINDVFWEQFLSASPLTGDTDEISSITMEDSFGKEQEQQTGRENGWDKTHCHSCQLEVDALCCWANKAFVQSGMTS